MTRILRQKSLTQKRQKFPPRKLSLPDWTRAPAGPERTECVQPCKESEIKAQLSAHSPPLSLQSLDCSLLHHLVAAILDEDIKVGAGLTEQYFTESLHRDGLLPAGLQSLQELLRALSDLQRGRES